MGDFFAQCRWKLFSATVGLGGPKRSFFPLSECVRDLGGSILAYVGSTGGVLDFERVTTGSILHQIRVVATLRS